jgi:hypothetical protein
MISVKAPVFRSIAWLGVAIQAAFVVLLAVMIARVFGIREPTIAFLFGAMAHAVLFRLMRVALTAEHRRGVALVGAQQFAEAAIHFEASYEQLTGRPWIDRFRWLLLGGAAAISYREMALCNAAFCYSQVGDGTRAIALYELALREFPQSKLATAALNMIRAAQQTSYSPSS